MKLQIWSFEKWNFNIEFHSSKLQIWSFFLESQKLYIWSYRVYFRDRVKNKVPLKYFFFILTVKNRMKLEMLLGSFFESSFPTHHRYIYIWSILDICLTNLYEKIWMFFYVKIRIWILRFCGYPDIISSLYDPYWNICLLV